MSEYEAIVVGGGPAGLSAATWLGRYRCRTLLLDSGEYRNRWTEQVHGFLGSDPVPPEELLQRARRDLDQYPNVELRRARVDSLAHAEGDAFDVTTGVGSFRTGAIVLATGVTDRFPEVEGFFEHYGADAFHCPDCDGFEARGSRVAVFGWSEEVASFSIGLLNWATSVTVVTEGRSFEGGEAERAALEAHGIPLLEDDAVELLGPRGSLKGVRLRGGAVLDCDVVFFSLGNAPAGDLAEQLGCGRDSEGCIVVDEEGATTVPQVWAAGDMTPGQHLAVVAAAKGAVAGIACARWIRRRRPARRREGT